MEDVSPKSLDGAVETPKTASLSEPDTYVLPTPQKPFKDTTEAQKRFLARVSWYGEEFAGQRMANGQVFDPNVFSVACSSAFPLGAKFVFHFNGLEKEAICTDRGNFEKLGRQFDFSEALFSYFAPLDKGVIVVEVERLD